MLKGDERARFLMAMENIASALLPVGCPFAIADSLAQIASDKNRKAVANERIADALERLVA